MPLVIYMILDGCIVKISFFFKWWFNKASSLVVFLTVCSDIKRQKYPKWTFCEAGFGFTNSVCFHEEHTKLNLIWLPLIYGVGGKDQDTCLFLEQVSGSMLLHNLSENLHLALNKN